MSITYRYHCSVEGVHVFETKDAGDPAPTVCINEGGALTADSLTIFRQPLEVKDLAITANVDFLSSVVANLSHNQLGDTGINSHANIDSHMTDVLVHKNDNYFATAAPIATNDESEGYTTGSRWYNVNTNIEYYCVNSNVGLAVWKNTSAIDDSASSTVTSYSSSKVVSDFSATGHTHTAANVTDFNAAADARITLQKAAVNGLATLDAGGKVPSVQLPNISITNVSVVADITARDALTVQTGDVAKVLDSDGLGNIQTYIYDGAAWVDIQETSDVISVNGLTGEVVLGKIEVGLSNVENLKVNLVAVVAPVATDDSAAGYAVGSRWVDTVTDKEYVCVDATATAAVWRLTSALSTTDLTEGSNLYYTEARVDVNTNVAANTTHRSQIDNPHTVTKTQVGLSEVENLKVNLAAVVAPVATDDSAAGYAVGSRWIDTVTDKEYVCVDATATAAVWKRTTLETNNNKFIVSSAEQSINNTGIWVAVDQFIYPGSSITAANVDRIMVNAFTDIGTSSFDVRIVNITKTSGIPIVATSTGNVNTETSVINLNGQALDLPTVDDVFEVEVKKNSGDNTIFIRYFSVMMVYI